MTYESNFKNLDDVTFNLKTDKFVAAPSTEEGRLLVEAVYLSFASVATRKNMDLKVKADVLSASHGYIICRKEGENYKDVACLTLKYGGRGNEGNQKTYDAKFTVLCGKQSREMRAESLEVAVKRFEGVLDGSVKVEAPKKKKSNRLIARHDAKVDDEFDLKYNSEEE